MHVCGPWVACGPVPTISVIGQTSFLAASWVDPAPLLNSTWCPESMYQTLFYKLSINSS